MSELENEIVRLWYQGRSLRGIATDLRIGRKRVSAVITSHQQSRDSGARHPELPRPVQKRSSQLDAFQPAIAALLERYPNMTAQRVFEELGSIGYKGGYTIVRERVRSLRRAERPAVVERFETAPGLQGQMDWAVYNLDFTSEGKRRVNLFSYILGYSRRQYLYFTERQDFENTIRQHVHAFEHLGGAAATCLYDNMKVVVQRWEDDQPIYNARFLSFATHYGFRPQACRPGRPQTKGKVERPFYYVEKNLLNGRTFRSLEHLNEVTRWWLAEVADVRLHRETRKRPIDAHGEELAHLISLPEHHYDTAEVVYRLVSSESRIAHRQNKYSVPWNLVGELLPVRITEDELIVYDHSIQEVARHRLFNCGEAGRERDDPRHRPPRDQRLALEVIRQQFSLWGTLAEQFLEGLLNKQRYGRQQALRVLALFRNYQRSDVLAALERAVRYHAYSFSSLERILGAQATPKPSWQNLSDDQQQLLKQLMEDHPAPPRPTSDYQFLLFEPPSDNHGQDQQQHPPEERTERPDSQANPPAPGDAADPDVQSGPNQT